MTTPIPSPPSSPELYDFRREAQRIIDAIEPRAGATMTLMCALREAYEAGRAALAAAPVEPAPTKDLSTPAHRDGARIALDAVRAELPPRWRLMEGHDSKCGEYANTLQRAHEILDRLRAALAALPAEPPVSKCFRRCTVVGPDRVKCAEESGLTITICNCDCHDAALPASAPGWQSTDATRAAFREGWHAGANMAGTLSEEECWQTRQGHDYGDPPRTPPEQE